MISAVVAAMRTLRIGHVDLESDLYGPIGDALSAGGISFRREVVLGPRCRIDFLTDSRVGIEVKKGKIGSRDIAVQIERYAAFDAVAAILIVVERSVYVPPETANGKPVAYLSLSKLRGISL